MAQDETLLHCLLLTTLRLPLDSSTEIRREVMSPVRYPEKGKIKKIPPPRPPKPPTPRPSTPTPPPLQTTHSAYLEKERDRCYRLHICNESSCRVRICASGSSWDTFQNAMQKRRFASATNSPKMDLRNLRLFSFFIWAHVYASKVFK